MSSIQNGVTPIYPSELEYWSESWRKTKVQYIKMSIAAQWGVQKTHLEHIRGLWDYRCTAVQLYGEYRKMLL
jgi:hypothetical protein